MEPSDFKRALMESNWFNSLNRCTCKKDQSITCIVHPIAKHPSVAPGEPRDDSDYCMACKGSGEVIVLCQDGIDPQDAYEAPMTCPECDGTGVSNDR